MEATLLHQVWRKRRIKVPSELSTRQAGAIEYTLCILGTATTKEKQCCNRIQAVQAKQIYLAVEGILSTHHVHPLFTGTDNAAEGESSRYGKEVENKRTERMNSLNIPSPKMPKVIRRPKCELVSIQSHALSVH